MSAPNKFRVGLELALIAMTFGALMLACGSISVIGADGSTGSGGAPGAGTGGAPGGQGGKGGKGGGGFTGGTGGVTGGTGGHGTGAVGGTGGGVGGGSGMLGCSDLQKLFVVALAEAKSCVVGAAGNCAVATFDRLECGCTTFVNQSDKLDAIRRSWTEMGCGTGVCPGTLCVAYKSGVCTAPTSGAGSPMCQNQIGLPTP